MIRPAMCVGYFMCLWPGWPKIHSKMSLCTRRSGGAGQNCKSQNHWVDQQTREETERRGVRGRTWKWYKWTWNDTSRKKMIQVNMSAEFIAPHFSMRWSAWSHTPYTILLQHALLSASNGYCDCKPGQHQHTCKQTQNAVSEKQTVPKHRHSNGTAQVQKWWQAQTANVMLQCGHCKLTIVVDFDCAWLSLQTKYHDSLQPSICLKHTVWIPIPGVRKSKCLQSFKWQFIFQNQLTWKLQQKTMIGTLCSKYLHIFCRKKRRRRLSTDYQLQQPLQSGLTAHSCTYASRQHR